MTFIHKSRAKLKSLSGWKKNARAVVTLDVSTPHMGSNGFRDTLTFHLQPQAEFAGLEHRWTLRRPAPPTHSPNPHSSHAPARTQGGVSNPGPRIDTPREDHEANRQKADRTGDEPVPVLVENPPGHVLQWERKHLVPVRGGPVGHGQAGAGADRNCETQLRPAEWSASQEADGQARRRSSAACRL